MDQKASCKLRSHTVSTVVRRTFSKYTVAKPLIAESAETASTPTAYEERPLPGGVAADGAAPDEVDPNAADGHGCAAQGPQPLVLGWAMREMSAVWRSKALFPDMLGPVTIKI